MNSGYDGMIMIEQSTSYYISPPPLETKFVLELPDSGYMNCSGGRMTLLGLRPIGPWSGSTPAPASEL